MDDYYSMRPSNDADRSDPVSLSSLGVIDLDTIIGIINDEKKTFLINGRL